MAERKPKKLSYFFPLLFCPVLGLCVCVDSKLPSMCHERKRSAWSSNAWNTLQSCSSVCGEIVHLLLRQCCCALWTWCAFLHQAEFASQQKGTVHAIKNWLLWVQTCWMPVHQISDYLLAALLSSIVYFRPVSLKIRPVNQSSMLYVSIFEVVINEL